MIFDRVDQHFISLEGLLMLEPSAGKGAIAIPFRDAGVRVICIEQNADRAGALYDMGFAEVICADFMEHSAMAGVYDIVGMNPPFENGQDMEHVEFAYELLKEDGGILVAVMSPGWTFRSDNQSIAFREWYESLERKSWKMLPDNSFRKSGTNVNTGLLVIKK